MKRFLAFFCVLLLPFLLMGEEQKEPGAWVSYIDGKTAVIRNAEGKSERLTQNTIVQEGDRIITYDSSAEVDIGGVNLLRLWKGSNAGFIYLQNEVRVEIEGDAYLQVEDTGKKLSVVFSNSISDIVDPGLYRFRSGKSPEIIVFYGELETEYKGQKKVLRWKDIGLLKVDKVSVCSTDSQFVKDKFDMFNEKRAREMEKGGGKAP